MLGVRWISSPRPYLLFISLGYIVPANPKPSIDFLVYVDSLFTNATFDQEQH